MRSNPAVALVPHELHSLIYIEMMFPEILADQQLHGMPHGAGAQAGGGRRQRRGIQNREGGTRAFLAKYLELEAGAGIGDSCDPGVAFKGIVRQAQLQILEDAELEQPIHVLVAAGGLQPVFDFQHAALHGLGRSGKSGAVGNRSDFVGVRRLRFILVLALLLRLFRRLVWRLVLPPSRGKANHAEDRRREKPEDTHAECFPRTSRLAGRKSLHEFSNDALAWRLLRWA